jgi:hypothetical protein
MRCRRGRGKEREERKRTLRRSGRGLGLGRVGKNRVLKTLVMVWEKL